MSENHESEILEETLDGIFDANGKRLKQLRLGQIINDVGDALDQLDFSRYFGTGDALNWILSSKEHDLEGIAQEATEHTRKVMGGSGHNDSSDAYRHALWSFRMAQKLGPSGAKRVGDGHERRPRRAWLEFSPFNAIQPDGELVMDLFNNHMGRKLFAESGANRDMSLEEAGEIVLKALGNGRLQSRPFTVKN